eukprot:INCI9281.1.p1 GENE.INCI9281.1~~INCI9281.1.p1  ORF type:complete len:781 (+),score=152.98 INCI9281.1:169-2511(+)
MSLLSRVTAEVRAAAGRFSELRGAAAAEGRSLDATESLLSEVSSLTSTLRGRLGSEVEKLRARANEKDPDRQTCGPKTAKRMQELCSEFDKLAKDVAELEASLRSKVDKARQQAAAIAAQRAAEAAAAREAADIAAEAEAQRRAELAARSAAEAAVVAAEAEAAAEAEMHRKRLRKEQAAAMETRTALEVAAATKHVAADSVGSTKVAQLSPPAPSSDRTSLSSRTSESAAAGTHAPATAGTHAPASTFTDSLRRSQPTLKIVTDSTVMRRELEFAGRRQETVAVFWCPKALDTASQDTAEFLRKQSAIIAFLTLRCPDMPVYHCCLPLATMQSMRPMFPPDVQASIGGHIQDAALSLSIHAAAVVHRFPLQDQTGNPSAEAPNPSSLPVLRRSIEDVLDAADAFVVASILRSRHARLVNVSVPNSAGESSGSTSSAATSTATAGSSHNAVTMVGVVTNLKRLKTSTGGAHTYLKALNLLRQIVGKIVENPSEPRYQRIKLQSKAYQSKLAAFDGGSQCMHACGFREQAFPSALGDDRYLVMTANLDDPSQLSELRGVVEALSAAISRLEGSTSRASNTSTPVGEPAQSSFSFPSPSRNSGGFSPGLDQGNLASMMSNPMVQQALQNPELIRNLMGGAGGLDAMLQSPLAQEMLRNPQMMQDTMQRMQQNPEMMRAAQSVARQMGGIGALGGLARAAGADGAGFGAAGLNAQAPAPAPAQSGFGFGGYTPPPSSASSASSSGQSTAQAGAPTPETDDTETNNATNSGRQNRPRDDQRGGS